MPCYFIWPMFITVEGYREDDPKKNKFNFIVLDEMY
jgi:hypothetical protein